MMSALIIFGCLFTTGAIGYWFGWSDRLLRKPKIEAPPTEREMRAELERLQVENKQLRHLHNEWQSLVKRQAAARLVIPDSHFRGLRADIGRLVYGEPPVERRDADLAFVEEDEGFDD